jgi:glycosyltransferase involved in cell wall biosynthesis
MRYLIISYDFPPKNSPRAFRWGTIARYLAEQGHTVDVITQGKNSKSEYVKGVNVHQVQEFLLGRFRTAQSGGRVDLSKIEENSPNHAKWKIILKKYAFIVARWVYNKIWKNLYWPDFAAMWIPSALSTARKLKRKHNYSAVITVSLPFTGHVIGLKLKKEFPGMFWLADMGDPFSIMKSTQTNNYKLYGDYNHRVEQDVFNLANAISVTTHETKQEYSPWLPPESFDKIKVMPPLFTPTDIIPKGKKSPDVLKLFYCGTLYKTIRNPSFLLQVFKAMADKKFHGKTLELHIMGDIHDTTECFEPYADMMDKQIFLHGRKPKEEVNKMMAESDILINICNDTFYQLPSKVVEYAASGKPVLNFARSDKDSSVNFFENYGNATTVNQSEGLDAALKQLTIFLKLPIQNLDNEHVESFLKPYLAESVCKQYLDVLPNNKEQDERAA